MTSSFTPVMTTNIHRLTRLFRHPPEGQGLQGQQLFCTNPGTCVGLDNTNDKVTNDGSFNNKIIIMQTHFHCHRPIECQLLHK